MEFGGEPGGSLEAGLSVRVELDADFLVGGEDYGRRRLAPAVLPHQFVQPRPFVNGHVIVLAICTGFQVTMVESFLNKNIHKS